MIMKGLKDETLRNFQLTNNTTFRMNLDRVTKMKPSVVSQK